MKKNFERRGGNATPGEISNGRLRIGDYNRRGRPKCQSKRNCRLFRDRRGRSAKGEGGERGTVWAIDNCDRVGVVVPVASRININGGRMYGVSFRKCPRTLLPTGSIVRRVHVTGNGADDKEIVEMARNGKI